MKADYIIRGGRVIDPAAGVDEIRDVVVCNMRVADPGSEAVECPASQIIDAAGTIVTPGLIDFHTHLFYEGSTFSIHPDMMIAQGTTAAVDAGSAGTATYEAFFKAVIAQSQVRIKGFLTVYSGGQLDPKLCEDFCPDLYNVKKMERVVEEYQDNLLGLKIRFSRGIVPDKSGTDYLKACVAQADALERLTGRHLRVCAHATDSPVTAGELAGCLRPGDIFAHCFQGAGNTIVLPDGSIDPGVAEARKRGVLFDAANGRGNFGLTVAKTALGAGFLPDFISTDLTVDKFNKPPYAKSLPAIMSKYLTLGLTLPEVIERVTARPAEAMGMAGQIGTLRPGAFADIAIFRQKEHRHIQKDFRDEELECNTVLVPQMTLCAGEIQFCQADFYL